MTTLATCCHVKGVIQREGLIKLVAVSGATMRTVSLIAAALIFSLTAVPHAKACGRRVAAYPKEPCTPGEHTRGVPYLGRGSWVIYRVGNEPYQLSVCSRTKALDDGGDAEVTRLRQLARTR